MHRPTHSRSMQTHVHTHRAMHKPIQRATYTERSQYSGIRSGLAETPYCATPKSSSEGRVRHQPIVCAAVTGFLYRHLAGNLSRASITFSRSARGSSGSTQDLYGGGASTTWPPAAAKEARLGADLFLNILDVDVERSLWGLGCFLGAL